MILSGHKIHIFEFRCAVEDTFPAIDISKSVLNVGEEMEGVHKAITILMLAEGLGVTIETNLLPSIAGILDVHIKITENRVVKNDILLV